MPNDYFISYAHKDNVSEDGKHGFVDEFVEKLKGSTDHKKMFGREIEVFFDKTNIHSMSDWDNRIRSCLAESRFFVVLLSPNYFHSEFCAKEFDWWMQHEMHRRVLGEGTAPMLIVAVDNLYDFNVNPLPEIPQNIQKQFPNWVKQIRQIQSGPDFDMHNLDRFKIDEILRSLCENTKDKYFKQVIAENSPINAGYPKYNENFVGRRENLRSLRQTLSTSCTTAISAVNGLGGIGKTELALTYGHAFAWDYELGRVFATCENSASLEDVILSSSIAEMHDLKLEGTNEQKLTTLYNELKRKIKLIEERNKEKGIDRTLGTHILLILDNVNRLELISQDSLDKLPDFFHVIITTRESANDFPYIHTESVDRLSEDESVELLSNLREFGADPQEAVAARNIAKLLDGFTLAVELTGSYLKKSPRVTYQKQYERLKANISDTMETMADKTQSLRRHQAECISAVLESTLSELSDNARKALEFAAFMPPDAVGLGWLPELLGLDEDEGLEVLDELTGFSLVTPLKGEPNIGRIHRLVAETVKQNIQKEEKPKKKKKEIIAKIREKCKDLLDKDEMFWCTPENSWNIMPVSIFCLKLAEQWTVEASNWNLTWMLDRSGRLLQSLGKMNEARNTFQQLLKISEEQAKIYPDDVTVQGNLSVSYSRLGDLENYAGNVTAARELYEKTLEICKRHADLMPDNVNVLQNLNASYIHFGSLEKKAGYLAAAREYFEKSLEISKRLYDLKPYNEEALLHLIRSFHRLSDIERDTGNFAAALKWDKKQFEFAKYEFVRQNATNVSFPIESFEEILNSAIDSNDAAAQERLEETIKSALLLIPKDVDIPWLSTIYTNIGDWAKVMGLVDTAREWYEKYLKISQKLADQMPENVDAQQDLSASYVRLGDLERDAGNAAAAREWYNKATEIFKRLFNLMPDNVVVQSNLSVSYYKLGELEQSFGNATTARDWYEKAMKIIKRLVDLMQDNIDTQHNLCALYERLGELEQAAGNAIAAREWYEEAMKNLKQLADLMPDNVKAQKELEWIKKTLAHVQKQP